MPPECTRDGGQHQRRGNPCHHPTQERLQFLATDQLCHGESKGGGSVRRVLMENGDIEGTLSDRNHFPNMVSGLHTAGCNQCGRRSTGSGSGWKSENSQLQFSREGDGWIMRAFALLDFNYNELLCLNRVQCNQKVLFISDVFGASCRVVDRKYLAQRQAKETFSTLIFPQERPPL